MCRLVLRVCAFFVFIVGLVNVGDEVKKWRTRRNRKEEKAKRGGRDYNRRARRGYCVYWIGMCLFISYVSIFFAHRLLKQF